MVNTLVGMTKTMVFTAKTHFSADDSIIHAPDTGFSITENAVGDGADDVRLIIQ
jgi:hypothetical protein